MSHVAGQQARRWRAGTLREPHTAVCVGRGGGVPVNLSDKCRRHGPRTECMVLQQRHDLGNLSLNGGGGVGEGELNKQP